MFTKFIFPGRKGGGKIMDEVKLVTPERVTYFMDITVQTRPYEPVKAGVTLSRDIKEGEAREAAFEDIKNWVEARCGEVFKRMIKVKKKVVGE